MTLRSFKTMTLQDINVVLLADSVEIQTVTSKVNITFNNFTLSYT